MVPAINDGFLILLMREHIPITHWKPIFANAKCQLLKADHLPITYWKLIQAITRCQLLKADHLPALYMLIYADLFACGMMKNLNLIASPVSLKNKLASDIIGNSDFIHRVFHQGESFRIYGTKDMGAAVAIQEGRNHMIFCGDWSDVELPLEMLPAEGVFVSSSPLSAVELLKSHYEVAGEWPSWHFLAPVNFDSGPWDEIGPIRLDEVPSISKYWTHSDFPEKEIMEKVKKYDSACVRENGIPASWCGLHFDMEGVGNMGFAHTLDEHRRKGYASLVTKALVNRLAARNRRATVHVIKENRGSVSLCESMGFQVIGELAWADFKRRE